MPTFFKPWTFITLLACLTLITGCDRIIGKAMDIEKSVTTEVNNAAQKVLLNEDQEKAKYSCLEAVAENFPGSEYKANPNPSLKGYLKYDTTIIVKKLQSEYTKEMADLSAGVDKYGPKSLSALLSNQVSEHYLVNCLTENGIVISMNKI